jgi:DNA-binding PucR family transcriptional regulator
VSFLLAEVNRLLQARADAVAGVAELQRFRLRWSDHLPGDRAATLVPDQRPWVLVVDADLPETASALNLVLALQAMGHRVAVVATRDLRADNATARSLALMDVAVLGASEHFTVEDALRRHRGLYRAVLLVGAPAASGYAVIARQHQPRAHRGGAG